MLCRLLSLSLLSTLIASSVPSLCGQVPSGRRQHVYQTVEVELDYEIHTTTLTENGKYYNFSNIPFAKPPVGNLRFAKPEAPDVIKEKSKKPINDGSEGRICHQTQVHWVSAQQDFVEAYSSGKDISNWTDHEPVFDYPELGTPDARVSEDCLLLDVVVPQKAFDEKDHRDSYPYPVMIWIYGGGFIFGDKNQFGNPIGLLNAAREVETEVIWVGMNYRLGAFGWLSSPKFINDGGTPNLGLHDQNLAIKWVKDNIERFGGDPESITVFGESAGAASIMHHLTAYGGPNGDNEKLAPLFQRAILQSPGFFPLADDEQEAATYQAFLDNVGVDSLAGLRAVSEQKLKNASNVMVQKSPYGTFTFGPAVEGSYTPKPPALALAMGERWPEPAIMVANNGDEGLLFTPPHIQSDAAFRTYISNLLPSLDRESLDDILDLYEVKNTSSPRRDQIKRVKTALAEVAITCNTLSLLESYGKHSSYKYVFNMLPAVHGLDALFTYYQTPPKVYPAPDSNGEKNAFILQRFLASFAMFGDPNYIENPSGNDTSPMFETYNKDDDGYVIEFEGVPVYNPFQKKVFWGLVKNVKSDDKWVDSFKCGFWESAPYWNLKSTQTQLGDHESL